MEEGAITQLISPFISPGAPPISRTVSVFCESDEWTCFHGGYPIYSHRADDQRMFRFITAQLVDSGVCRQVDIINCFGVSKNSVLRSVKKLRNEGAQAFFQPRKGRKGGTIFTPEILAKAQSLLNKGVSRKKISEQLGVKSDTLRKAMKDGRLHTPIFLPEGIDEAGSSKSIRDKIDGDVADILVPYSSIPVIKNKKLCGE